MNGDRMAPPSETMRKLSCRILRHYPRLRTEKSASSNQPIRSERSAPAVKWRGPSGHPRSSGRKSDEGGIYEHFQASSRSRLASFCPSRACARKARSAAALHNSCAIEQRSCARRRVATREERFIAAARDDGAGIRASTFQQLATDREPAVATEPGGKHARSGHAVEYCG